ncbi:hypothetical protein CHS0354_012739 [Potamilus streckersoni]|uniref:Uncharacterized protein n=1 Tax=Potamilus streckersoni TaxID=2493646 RepID=A0AAE0W4C9_9BIVA|nr:hypothetical protein CHS0354_012739 [Potamilus streckersoni]
MNILPEIYVSNVGRDALQLPHLPDPGNTDDDFSSDRLGFTIRLGKSLARGAELDEKVSIHKELSRKFSTPSEANDEAHDQWLTTSSHDATGDRLKHHTRETSKGIKMKKDLRRGNTVTNLPQSYITEESPRMKFQRVARTVRVITGVCLALKRFLQQELMFDIVGPSFCMSAVVRAVETKSCYMSILSRLGPLNKLVHRKCMQDIKPSVFCFGLKSLIAWPAFVRLFVALGWAFVPLRGHLVPG